jgi:phosphoglycerate kinase
MKLPSIRDIDISSQRVLIREDFNVPIAQGKILNDKRITAALPTIEYALKHKAAVILVSHLGRPMPRTVTKTFSLEPVASRLSYYLNRPVKFVQNWLNGIEVQPGEVVLCENVRLEAGEHTNDPILSKKIAALADIIVMDAFGVAHRISASTVGMIHHAQYACSGLLFESEIKHLTQALENPNRPIIAIIGGSKISTKLGLLRSLLAQVDHLLLGGGIANTFLVAKGYPIGQSIYEPDLIKEAALLLEIAHKNGCQIHLPQDHTVIHLDKSKQIIQHPSIKDIQPSDKIGDIGPVTAESYTRHINRAQTILWNGPMGIFEEEHFQKGTEKIAKAIQKSAGFSIAGGGETLLAIERYEVTPSYISTGGGSFLAFLEGKPLPVIHALLARIEKAN